MAIHSNCKHNYINVNLTHRLKVPTNNICSTQVDGKHVQVFKDLKITIENYVLHSDFQARDLDKMDIVLGYPWMTSVGTINLNLEKKFLKLWYKKKKVTLQDVSLNTKVEPKGEPTDTSTRTLEVIPIDTSTNESMVADTTNDTAAQEDLTQDVHQSTKAAP